MKNMKGCLTAMLLFFLLPAFAQELNHSVLEDIKRKAFDTHSDAVIIMQNGSIVYEDYFGAEEKPIYIASAGKSLVALAIGRLIDDGLLDSLDQPVHTLYPQWKQGNKKDITIRMLLNHTSGLQNNPNASVELEPPPDHQVHNVIELALAAELSSMPGEKVAYNNKAVALLGGIIEEASGKRMDAYFEDHFFAPLGITQYDWIRDKSGNPTAHGAFVLKPSDLLKFGQLLLDRGVYDEKRILSEERIDRMLRQGQEFTPIWGLLWWRLPEYEKRIVDGEIWDSWQAAGMSEDLMRRLDPLKGKLFATKSEYYAAMKASLGEGWYQVLRNALPEGEKLSKRIYSDHITAYYADGFRGNYLVIVPEHDIVAVRCADHEGFNYQTDFFTDFARLVSELGK
ncbi:MAG: serine hydrolase [Saprospiraceae bacterium]|nr:serine hydrolase [Saprospiraceae bacterium]